MERSKSESKAETISYIKELAKELRALSSEVEADTLAYLVEMILYESDVVLASDETDERRAKGKAIEAQRLYMSDALEEEGEI